MQNMKIFQDTKNMKTGSWRGNGLEYSMNDINHIL